MKRQTSEGKKHLFLLALLFSVTGFFLIAVNEVGDRLVSGSSAYISGEGQWIKAQKEATISLIEFTSKKDQQFYIDFLNHLEVIEGGRIARMELNAPSPNYDLIENSFSRGKYRAQNLPYLIWFYENLSGVEIFQNTVNYWIEGEVLINVLNRTAEEIHWLVETGNLTDEHKEAYLSRIFMLDNLLSTVESNLSGALGETVDWINTRVYWLNLLSTIIVFLILGGYSMFLVGGLFSRNEKLKTSRDKYKQVLNHSYDVICQLDIKSGKFKYMSPSIKNMLGYEAGVVKQGGVAFLLDNVHPDDSAQMESEMTYAWDENIEEKIAGNCQYRIRSKHGVYVWVNIKRSLLRDENGKPMAMVWNIRDISERKKINEVLDASLKEKEMLLAEIHHRVKNNLSIVSSLVELEKGSHKNAVAQSFSDIQSRIKSIALVHEKLYQNETFAEVDLSDYLDDLLNMIQITFNSDKREITIDRKLDSIAVNIKRAVPIGLICNELISNCYKYAFVDKKEGSINVELKVNENNVKLTVSDNGIGLPKEFEKKKKKSLGMTLIEVLTKQVDGELSYSTNGGAVFSVEFEARKDRV
jgi:PAS domain S-box-containing protein